MVTSTLISDARRPEVAMLGKQIHLQNVSGRVKNGDDSHLVKDVSSVQDLTINGRYLSITLGRMFLDVQLHSLYDHDDGRRVSLLEVIYTNTWDFRMALPSSDDVVIIDGEGFQHTSKSTLDSEYKLAFDGVKTLVPVYFPTAPHTLEDHAKVKSWVWFDTLAENVPPRRIIFSVDVFDPGATSGWVKDKETLEFVINRFAPQELKSISFMAH